MTLYFQEKSKYLYNCKNLKKTFLQLRCCNVLLHLKCKLPLYKPEIEFENLPGAKALATDHRDSFLKRLEGQQNIGYFLSLFSVIAIIKWYWTKRQLFSHGKLFVLFLCCIWRQPETGWASKVSPIRESYDVAFQPDSSLRAVFSSWAVRGGVTFWKTFKSKAFVVLSGLFSLKERFHNFSSRRSTSL